MEPHRLLRRKAASKYLQDVHGVMRAPSTLAKYAVIGGGPVFQRMGRDPVYTPVNLDEWVASKLSGPMRSTSDNPSCPDGAPRNLLEEHAGNERRHKAAQSRSRPRGGEPSQ